MAIVVTKENADQPHEIEIAITVVKHMASPMPSERCRYPKGPCVITEVAGSARPPRRRSVLAGWAELAVVLISLRSDDGLIGDLVVSPEGARASASCDAEGELWLTLDCGADPEDAGEMTVLRSYCMGAVHMALGCVHLRGDRSDEQAMRTRLCDRWGSLGPRRQWCT